MNIQIFGQKELLNHIEKGREVYSHCISIINPGEPFYRDDDSHESPDILKEVFTEVLELKFWDTDRKELIVHHSSKRIPLKSDIEQVLDFIEKTKHSATGYTIHCWRGISRSAAVGLGILQYFMKNEKEAVRKLVSVRRAAMPLKLIIRYYDEIMGSNLSDSNNSVIKARIEAMKKEFYSKKYAELEELDE